MDRPSFTSGIKTWGETMLSSAFFGSLKEGSGRETSDVSPSIVISCSGSVIKPEHIQKSENRAHNMDSIK